ncbi:MAG: translocation/assembly module TamB domain-containing protein [Candidatus Rokubacteria bacterium]|nr:translocation/assembly module TamB domain-containing protein [Candidatus Rokubacteria bacterium]
MRRWVLLGLLLLALAGAVGVAVSKVRPLLEWAQATILEQATARLGREVAVGRVEVRAWGVIVLRDVALARWERLDEGRAFEARALTLSLKLLPLLRGRVEIGSIELAAPRLWVEVDEQGRSNWDSLLARPKADGLPWPAVRITAGGFVFRDRRHAVSVEGRGIEGRVAPGPDGQFRAGRGRVSVGALAVAVRDRAYPELAVKAHGGWEGTSLDLSGLTVAAGRSGLELRGRIEDLRTLEGSLEGTATLAVQEIAPYLPGAEGWEGRVALRGTLAGSWRHPVVQATAEVRGLSGPRAVRLARGLGQVVLRRDALRLADWRVEAYGGRFEGEATATLDPPLRYQGQLRTAGLDLRALPAPLPPLRGTARGTLAFRGAGRAVTAEATVELSDAAPASRQGWEQLPPHLVDLLIQEGPWRASGKVAWAEGRMTIESARLASDAHRLSGSGTVQAEGLALAVELQTDKVAALLPPRLSALEGAARWAGRVEGPLDALRVSGRAEGRQLRWEGLAAESLRAEFGWSGRTLTVTALSLAGPDGRLTARGVAEIPGGDEGRPGAITAEGEVEDLALAPLLRRAGLTLAASGRISGPWQWRQRGETRTGHAALVLESGSLAGEPIPRGRATLALEGTTLRVSSLHLETAAGDLRGEGVIEPGASLSARLVATIRSLGALPWLREVAPPLSGEGSIRLDLGGTPRAPRMTAHGELRDLRLGDLPLGSLEGRAGWDGARLTLTARLPALAIALEGEGKVGTGAPYRAVATLSGSPLRRLIQGYPGLVQRVGAVAGSVTGEVVVEGAWGAPPRMRGVLTELVLQALGEEWRSAGVSRWAYAAGRITVEGVRVESRVGRLTARGSLAPGRAWELGLEGRIPLTLLEGVREGSLVRSAQGFAGGELAVSGPWETPRLSGRLGLEQARVELVGLDEAITLRRGELRLDGDRLSLETLEGEVGEGGFTATGEAVLVGWQPDRFSATLTLLGQTLRPAQLARALRRLALAPAGLEPLAGQPLWEEATIKLAGEVHVRGRWREPDLLTASGRLTRLELLTPQLRLENLEPVRFRYSREGLGVESLQLAGDGTRVMVSGRVGAKGELGLDLRGVLDLRLLAERFPRLIREAQGPLRLQIRLGGSWARPEASGWASVEGGSLHIRRVPQPVVIERARLAFEGSREGTRARIQHLEGRWGEGTYSLEGGAALGKGFAVERLDVALKGEALRFRVPEVGHGVVDAALRLSGEVEALTLAGQITLRRAVYSRDLVPAVRPAGPARRLEEVLAEVPPPLRALRLDLEVEAPGGVWIRNNLARVELRGELSFRGTLGHPLILGRAEALQGSVVYGRREFRILSATADLLDPRRLNPQFTVTAETTVEEIAVQLYLTGTLERFTIQLASDPPLRQEQILALVVGGAASFVAGEAYGRLLDEANKVAKLDVFQIDPTTGGAQLRVGKRLSERLDVSFSRTVGATPTQRLAVEYRLTDQISLIGSQDERGIYGFDVKFSLSFR